MMSSDRQKFSGVAMADSVGRCTDCVRQRDGLLALDEEGKGKTKDEGRDRTCSLSTKKKIAHLLKYIP